MKRSLHGALAGTLVSFLGFLGIHQESRGVAPLPPVQIETGNPDTLACDAKTEDEHLFVGCASFF